MSKYDPYKFAKNNYKGWRARLFVWWVNVGSNRWYFEPLRNIVWHFTTDPKTREGVR